MSTGSTVLLYSAGSFPWEISAPLVFLLVAALVSENFALSLPIFNVSLAFPLIVAATVLAGPPAAGLVAAVSFTNWDEIKRHRPLSVLTFNFGQLVLSACLGAWAYVLFGGVVLYGADGFTPLVFDDLSVSGLALALSAVVTTIPNMGMTAYAASALRGSKFMSAFLAMLAYAPTQLALAAVGLLMAQVLTIEVMALPLFLLPLLLAREIYRRYETLGAVYIGTVQSLVAALEEKDPYTKGHSERVARFAVEVGQQLGLSDGDLDILGKAALLHDIGKLALSSATLTKPVDLSTEERAAVRRHPEIGAHMVQRIPLLRTLAGHVESHHEWVDGSGYPAGTLGSDISILAKVLAVADAYDAMTTDRPYRLALAHDEAVAELLTGGGTQFDIRVVTAFIQTFDAGLGGGSSVGVSGLTEAVAT